MLNPKYKVLVQGKHLVVTKMIWESNGDLLAYTDTNLYVRNPKTLSQSIGIVDKYNQEIFVNDIITEYRNGEKIGSFLISDIRFMGERISQITPKTEWEKVAVNVEKPRNAKILNKG